MAKYRLNLTKSKMYQLIQLHCKDLPKMCRCEFTHYQSTYWMTCSAPEDAAYSRIKFTAQICCGIPMLSVEHVYYDDEHPLDPDERVVHDLSPLYLFTNKMVREVS